MLQSILDRIVKGEKFTDQEILSEIEELLDQAQTLLVDYERQNKIGYSRLWSMFEEAITSACHPQPDEAIEYIISAIREEK